MQYIQPFGYGAFVQLVGDPVHSDVFLSVPDVPVATSILRPRPQPTATRWLEVHAVFDTTLKHFRGIHHSSPQCLPMPPSIRLSSGAIGKISVYPAIMSSCITLSSVRAPAVFVLSIS